MDTQETRQVTSPRSVMDDPGLQRTLTQIDQKMETLHQDLREIARKLDMFVLEAVTKTEFNAYQGVRRNLVMWGVGMLITNAVAVLIVVITR